MSDQLAILATQFEAHRPHLRRVAYRMLGSSSEADDVVQEAWVRLHRADGQGVENLGGWLTTVVARVCLDHLRSRKAKGETSIDEAGDDAVASARVGDQPDQSVQLADSVGLAMLIVLETLGPAERVAFVLHDLFGLSFEQIAPIVERTPAAARQLASRARRRIQGAPSPEAVSRARQQAVVEAFLAASRDGNFAALLTLLDPDVALRADAAAVAMGAAAEVRGAAGVAETFKGRARVASVAWINGAPGLVWAPGGTPRVVFEFVFREATVIAIELIADPARIDALDLELRDGDGTSDTA